MEFLRFGSHIPGAYWGCCACSVIQNFKIDPDVKWSSQVQYGDSGSAVVDPSRREQVWVGPTYGDIFKARIRIGEFDNRDMPNHAFIAILTEGQCTSDPGKKWLKLLREVGFEFIRTVGNSVYNGPALLNPDSPGSPHKNHIFGLFRNIGNGSVKDQFTPPKAWSDLPKVKGEANECVLYYHELVGSEGTTEKLTERQRQQDLVIWEALGPPKFLTEKEVEDAGAPVVLMGLRDEEKPTATKPAFPPEPKEKREANIAKRAALRASKASGAPTDGIFDPFACEDVEDDECEETVSETCPPPTVA